MLNLFKKKQASGTKVEFKIDGMHCTSCSMSIDGELEDTEGVLSASTSYAKGKTVVEYDKEKVGEQELRKVIEGLGYGVG